MAAILPNLTTDENIAYGIPELYAADPALFAERSVANSVGFAIIDQGFNMGASTRKLWVNQGEIAANGIDDDGNGYIDDINGWHFGDDDNVLDETTSHANSCAAAAAAPGPEWSALANVIILPSASSAGYGMQYAAVTSGIKIASHSFTTNLLTGYDYTFGLLDTNETFLFVSSAAFWPNHVDEATYPGVMTVAAFNATTNNCSDTGNYDGDNTNVLVGAFANLVSFAVPVPGSVAAMLWCKDPSLTYSDVRSLIIAGCEHAGNSATYTKYGIISHKRSYEAAFGSLTATQVFIGTAFGRDVKQIAGINGRAPETIAAINGREIRSRRMG